MHTHTCVCMLTHTHTHTHTHRVFILGSAHPDTTAMVGWVLKKQNYLSILISDFSVVVSKSTPDSSVDKHQYFSLDNIRLRLKWIKNDIPMKGTAFPLGLFCALNRTSHSSTTWHLSYENGSQLELWREHSGDITLYSCFKCSFSKSYQLSSSIIQCLWCMHLPVAMIWGTPDCCLHWQYVLMCQEQTLPSRERNHLKILQQCPLDLHKKSKQFWKIK